MEVDAKIVDMAILTPPRMLKSGGKVLANFTLLLRPMRITGCALVVSRGAHVIYTPDRSIRIARDALPEIIEAVVEHFKQGHKSFAS